MQERVQKIIAAAGLVSRRAAESLILEGRVRVNGAIVTELGTKADPERDHIKVDGKLINPTQPRTYLMLNKPVGFVTTMSDPEGRPVVSSLLQNVKARVYPVGRLDYNTEGLLLLTNDGDFAHLITHPRHELPKTYLVKVKGVLSDAQVENLERGVFLKDGKTAPAKVKKLRKEESNSWIQITIHEGRKRQVRRMIDHTGHSVIKLKRIRVGGLNLGDLPLGTYRHLTADEVRELKDAALRQQGTWSTAPADVPAVLSADRPVPRERRAHREPALHSDRDQRTFDAWASATAKRRRREREGTRVASAPRRERTGPSSIPSRRKRSGRSERATGAYARGASGPVLGRKPKLREREQGIFGGGSRQERQRSGAEPLRGPRTAPGGHRRGDVRRGTPPDRERGASRPSRGKAPAQHTRSPRRSGGPAWRSDGPHGRPSSGGRRPRGRKGQR